MSKTISVTGAWIFLLALALTPGSRSAAEQKADVGGIVQEAHEAEPSDYIKLMRYDPQGHLIMEADRIGWEQFVRRFFPDGSVREYTHWRNGKWLAGYSVNPDKKKRERFIHGTGELTFWE